MANRNWASGGKTYTMHVSPVLIDLNFTVDSTAQDGITDLKGPAVSEVLMHSDHATPSMTIADGTILIKLQDNYNRVFNAVTGQIVSPTSGSDVKIDNSALTPGRAYVITTVGNSTTAQWQAVGLPQGITPAEGVAFIATAVGAGANTSTSRVQTTDTSGSNPIAILELAGDPSLTCSPNPSANQGAYLIMQARDTNGALVAIEDGSKVSVQIYLSNSSITVQGE